MEIKNYLGQSLFKMPIETNEVNTVNNLPLANGLYTIVVYNKGKLITSTRLVINK